MNRARLKHSAHTMKPRLYAGERPCIPPIAMMELTRRLASRSKRGHWRQRNQDTDTKPKGSWMSRLFK